MAGRLKNGSPLDKPKVLKEEVVTKKVSKKKKGLKGLFKKSK